MVYNRELTFEDNDSLTKISQGIKQGSIVLEFGPANGSLTRYLKEQLSCLVYIVEIDKDAFLKAKQYAVGAICADAEDLSWLKEFSNVHFDAIIFADVLEHLKEPVAVLLAAKSLLSHDGAVFISAPNIAHSDILFSIYQDNFQYATEGLLDKTHIHFFTYHSLLELFQKVGLRVVEEDNTIIEPFNTELGIKRDFIDKDFVLSSIKRPLYNVYQYVFKLQTSIYVDEHNIQEISHIRHNLTGLVGSFYLDTGSGFSEHNRLIQAPQKIENQFVYYLELSDTVQYVRFDPIENIGCVVRIVESKTSCGDVELFPIKGIRNNNIDIFAQSYPRYLANLTGQKANWLRIKAEVVPLTDELLKSALATGDDYSSHAQVMPSVIQMVADAEKRAGQLRSLLAETTAQQNDLKQRFEDLLVEKEAVQRDHERHLEELIEEKEALQHVHKQRIDGLIEETQQLRQLYQEISNAAFWRVTKPLRMILTFIKKTLRPSQVTIDEEGSLRYSVDILAFENDVLDFSGWIFPTSGNIDNLRLKIIVKNTVFLADLVSGLRRDDVEKQFGNQASKYSGFRSKTMIENCRNFLVYLTYSRNGQNRELFIRKFKTPISGTIAFYRRKITRQNLVKMLNYLSHLRLDKVVSAASRARIMSLTDEFTISIDLVEWQKKNITQQPLMIAEPKQYMVDIIIPIFNGYRYFDRLFTTLTRTEVPYQLFVVNDCSTDVLVTPYLDELATRDRRVCIIHNTENLGFVRSVNKALEMTKNHVVLLNSDIELPPLWLERLIRPIILNRKIASATPYTNSGTLCSFPVIGKDNPIFEEMTAENVDRVFQSVIPTYTEIPTGVGFCIALSRFALHDIGILDAESFPRGYGEENDWCQRALKKGFWNVQVENLFVYHRHGGSFANDEKKKLIEKNEKTLAVKHPAYLSDVARYFAMDPLRTLRQFMVLKLSLSSGNQKPVAALTHHLGGGAASYLNQVKDIVVSEMGKLFIVFYDYQNSAYIAQFSYGSYESTYRFFQFSDLLEFLSTAEISQLMVNELVTWPDLYESLMMIMRFKIKHQVQIRLFLHDYYSLCPTINLLNNDGIFCNLPSSAICENCAKINPLNQYLRYNSMKDWRMHWMEFLNCCDDIIVFSESSAILLRQVYGNLPVHIIPHQVTYFPEISKVAKSSSTYNIGLLGILNQHKGLEIIKSMLAIIERTKDNIRFILIGTSDGHINSPYLTETGKYLQEDLPNIALANDVDMFFISSICPETFSYTTEEAIKLSYPVASFAIGAPAERLIQYEKGMVLRSFEPSQSLQELRLFCERHVGIMLKNVSHEKILFVTDHYSFSARYRVEHFIEQLLMYGISSNFILSNDLATVDLSKYNAYVIYRCEYSIGIASFINKIHALGRHVIYDIDDYIFDFEAIKNLPFMVDPEYRNFSTRSHMYHSCMALCDAFLTSTTHMKIAIARSFPQKPVCVNRNVASMAMVSLSLRAMSVVKHQNRSQVTIGYFSGSKTHDFDFEIIKKVLLELMAEQPHLRLKFGGCLSVADEFQQYKDRITLVDFVDWRQLPTVIASVDINLMPLEDTFFHTCKSENKWTEASLVGVVTVASWNNELSTCIEHGIDGYLCRNNQDWHDILTYLILNQQARIEMGQRAHIKVLRDSTTRTVNSDAIDLLRGVGMAEDR